MGGGTREFLTGKHVMYVCEHEWCKDSQAIFFIDCSAARFDAKQIMEKMQQHGRDHRMGRVMNKELHEIATDQGLFGHVDFDYLPKWRSRIYTHKQYVEMMQKKLTFHPHSSFIDTSNIAATNARILENLEEESNRIVAKNQRIN